MWDWSDEAREALTAREIRFWTTEPVMGFWCPACNLPSAIEFALKRDPSDPDEQGIVTRVCVEDSSHPVPREDEEQQEP